MENSITFDRFDIQDFLRLLDIQREYCIKRGAEYFPGTLYIPTKRGNTQISYYNGHVNMFDRMLLNVGQLCVDNNNKHYIEWFDKGENK